MQGVPNDNPNCRRFDRGSNPVQMAYSFMDRFNATAAMNMSRFENTSLPDYTNILYQKLLTAAQNNLCPLFHLLQLQPDAPLKYAKDQYFEKLSDPTTFLTVMERVGIPSPSILDGKSPSEIELLVEGLSEVQQYGLASKIIYKFLKEIAFSQSRYCVVWEKDSSGVFQFKDAVSFASLRSDIFGETGRSVNSCDEARDFVLADSNSQKLEEVGNHFNNVKFTENEGLRSQKSDLATGYAAIRMKAFELLTDRTRSYFPIRTNNFQCTCADSTRH